MPTSNPGIVCTDSELLLRNAAHPSLFDLLLQLINHVLLKQRVPLRDFTELFASCIYIFIIPG
jgi:hypothetical protein